MDTKREQELVLENLGLVLSQLRKFKYTSYLGEDDLISVGTIGLLKAIRGHKPEKSKLSTYAWHIIKNEILAEIKKNKYTVPIKNNVYYLDNNELFEVLPDLSEIENNIITYKTHGYTNKEIAAILDIDKEIVRNLLQKIYRKIREANAE